MFNTLLSVITITTLIIITFKRNMITIITVSIHKSGLLSINIRTISCIHFGKYNLNSIRSNGLGSACCVTSGQTRAIPAASVTGEKMFGKSRASPVAYSP